MAARSDPSIVRLDPQTLQTLRGAFNVVETLVVQDQAPVAGIFDPVRLEMLREVSDGFKRVQETLSPEGSGELRLDPSQRVAVRQAVSAVESLITTDAGQEIVESVGARWTREDIPMLQDALDRIEPARNAEDLARSDLSYRLYTEVFDESAANEIEAFREMNDDVLLTEFKLNKFDRYTLCETPVEQRTPPITVGPDVDEPIHGGFSKLATLLTVLSNASRTRRLNAAERTREAVSELEFRMQDNRCYTKPDRRRLVLAGEKAADTAERGFNREQAITLLEMARWTQYRVRNGLMDGR